MTILKYGFVLAAAIIAMHVLSYLIEPTLLFSLIQKLVVGVLPACVVIYFALRQKLATNEGSLMFSEAFQTSLFTYIIGTFIGALFYFILINYINPELVTLGRETLANTGLAMIEKMGGEVGDTEELRKVFTEKINPFSLSMIMLDWLGKLFFPGLIVALLLAALGKS